MKKLFTILLLSIITGNTYACDICGCGVGSYYTGILPEFSKKIFGLRYRYNSLQTHINPGGSTSYLTTLEKFNTIDVWAGWTISQKFRLMGYIPLNFNEKTNQGTTINKTGIGDIGIQGFYRVFDIRGSSGKNYIGQSLWMGAGIKLPTGNYQPSQKDETGQSANTFQLGTGSLDFTLNMMYDLRIQDFGINTTASYKINTVNKDEYQYGNKLSSTLQAYYKVRVKKKFTIAPNAGLAYETAAKDHDGKLVADVSGGNILLAIAGAEFTTGKIAIGGNLQSPLSQHLAKGSVKANNRMMIHISFML
jgi:Putative MetA-pathway of phenol degradation